MAWDDLSTTDNAVIKLRRERPDIDWSKVQIDWAKRTLTPERLMIAECSFRETTD